ncbi:PEP-CTERM sorting domain-containing protein [Verrucomicrobiaceae bacterium 5K15]|uniref:PEP-CTERM sorting domain-containing protein n=1 Tax=Oceaniferula flava TaxID=2800421 RepID=A0AAE2VBG2_9BACT|nr:PEP-CTERM sorting domain-containing protein [Oceaniferula flavus]MBK1853721.1 PEP-CTERM sorting domain-containing protein [Oceaniferula flavus]MBM1135027.1 PEP-CTERM sorting domain-containing protein [Oceaniferula flavus]
MINTQTLKLTALFIALAPLSASAASLSVDFHGSVAPGFVRWDSSLGDDTDVNTQGAFHQVLTSTSDTYTAASTGFANDISATMTATNINTGANVSMFDLQNRANAPVEIYEDIVGASGSTGALALTINGLVIGQAYTLSVYALDSNGGTTNSDIREYTLTNGSSSTIDNVQWSANDFDASYSFVAEGASVTVQNTAGTAGSAMNGFTLTSVPEPSSAALLGLGGIALIMRRRK